MKTDIGGSTSRFRELLAADLQTLLSNHLNFITHHSAEHGGRIIKSAGDGYWLEFSSATGAARAAVEMQEALRLAQPSRGDDRLAIKVVPALAKALGQLAKALAATHHGLAAASACHGFKRKIPRIEEHVERAIM